MEEPIFEAALKAATDRMEEVDNRVAALDSERIELMTERANLQETVAALSALLDHKQPITSLGLTAACREILRGSPLPLTAQEIRDQLETIRFDFSAYGKQAISAVNTALARFEEQGTALMDLVDGKRYFIWKPSLPPPPGYIERLVQIKNAGGVVSAEGSARGSAAVSAISSSLVLPEMSTDIPPSRVFAQSLTASKGKEPTRKFRLDDDKEGKK